jgi:hypothetical protein
MMTTDELRKTLDSLIDRLCSGALSVGDFREGYYLLQAEHPAHEMSPYESDYYGQIQEALDWTVPSLDDEARRDGYMDEEQYRQNVCELRKRFRSADAGHLHLN